MQIADNATLLKRFLVICAFVIVSYITGFIYFNIAANEKSETLPKQGKGLIAVFTGGNGRIAEGVKLAKKTSNTLLISGAHEDVSLNNILQSNDINPNVADSLNVVLSQMARNTYGNVVEVDIYSYVNSIDYVVVVTSNYHLPRTKILMNAMIDLPIYYYPETSKDMGVMGYFNNLSNFTMVLREYNKYIKLNIYYLFHQIFKILGLEADISHYFMTL